MNLPEDWGEQNTLWGGEGTIDSSFKMAVMGQTLTEGKKKLVLELYVVGQLLDRIWLSNNNQHSRPSEVFGPV